MGFIKLTLEHIDSLGKVGDESELVGSNLKIEVDQLHQDEVVAVLLDAYTKFAQDLVNRHPKDCRNCAVFEFHSRLLATAFQLEQELMKKYMGAASEDVLDKLNRIRRLNQTAVPFANKPKAPAKPKKRGQIWEKL